MASSLKIEVAIPALNEEMTISKVVNDFRKALPEADIVVYNNLSTDKTAELAKIAGAKIVNVNRKGKGFVVREIFDSSKADIVVMVDGDDTYDAVDVKKLMEPVFNNNADMVIGTRLNSEPKEFRPLHFAGNKLITGILNSLFKTQFKDILSGYRIFNRKFIEQVPLIGTGFEIESELILQALENGMAVKEVEINFKDRPKGSSSKLSTFKDGYRIIITIISMLRDQRPLLTFSITGIFFALFGTVLWLLWLTNKDAGEIFKICRNVGALFIEFSVFLFMIGLVLNTINVRMRETMSLIKRKKNG